MSTQSQKIFPFIWFESEAEEAATAYTRAFDDAKISRVSRYGEGGPGPKNSVMSVDFTLAGQEFGALNGGPYYKLTPAVSFFVSCGTRDEIDRLWKEPGDRASILMPLDAYPFSERFGWLQDRFGVSWQLSLGKRDQKIAPFVMFIGKHHGKAEEAINFYLSLFRGSRILSMQKYGTGEGEPENSVKHAVFSLAGREFMVSENSFDHPFEITGAISFFVKCDSQREIDTLWNRIGEGGKPQQCGWIQDRYGVTWQIVPPILGEMLRDKDPKKAKNVMQAMLKMEKLDINTLQQAYDDA